MRAQPGVHHGLQPMHIDAELGRHLGGDPGGPDEDGVALLLGEAVHQQPPLQREWSVTRCR